MHESPQRADAKDHAPKSDDVTSSSNARCHRYGPWSDRDCPEAKWARSVVEKAGYAISDDTGSALIVSTGEGYLYLWTTAVKASDDPTKREIDEGAYRPLTRIQGVQVYEGHIRWVWDVPQLHVWVESADNTDVQLAMVRPLVRASAEVPYRR